MIKNLPDQYIVECQNVDQTNSVLHYIVNDVNYRWNYWRYVLKDKDKSHANVWMDIPPQYHNVTVISYKDWWEFTCLPTKSPIFKDGDVVYFLWENEINSGKILDTKNPYSIHPPEYKVYVNGENVWLNQNELSFSEWSREMGGFSQERPQKIGSWGWFWDDGVDMSDRYCIYGELCKIEHGMYYPKSKTGWNNFSTTNPYQHLIK